MGRKNKALLEIGGRSLLADVIDRLRPLFGEIMIIAAGGQEYASFGLPVHRDVRPGSGSLGGILTALSRSSEALTFCVACDMPFLNPAVVSLLLGRAGEGWEAVVPRLREGLEPLCAVYAVSLVPRIEEVLDGGERRIRRVLEGSRVLYLGEEELRVPDPELLSFFNVNTPADLERARELGGSPVP